MADPLRVYAGEASEELVHVQLDECERDRLLALAVLPRHLVQRLGDELGHEVLESQPSELIVMVTVLD